MRSAVPLTDLVDSLPANVPFVGPEAIERRRGFVFKARLGANESGFGASPAAQAALKAALGEVAWYGDPEGFELRAALADHHGVPLDCVVLGPGIDGLLGTLVRLVTEPRTPVVTSAGAYPTFAYHVAGHGGALVRVPYRRDHQDLEALAAAAHSCAARLVYLCNPDNPTGTMHNARDVQSFLDGLPAQTLLILDEAYGEFAPLPTAPLFDAGEPRLVRLRTFSKVHGLAGLRIGYALAPEPIIAAINRIRDHFSVSRPAQTAALASLRDRAFVADIVARTAVGRAEYEALATDLGLRTIRSVTNFVAFDAGSSTRARALLLALEDRRVFVRMPTAAPLDRLIRVTVGTPKERAVFADALRDAWERA